MSIQISDHFTYGRLFRFTIPTIIMMIFTSIYGVIDGLFVTNVVGSEAFASVNLIMPFIMILGAFGFMMGAGGSALVSKTLGTGKKEKANEYFSMIILFIIIVGILLSVFGALLMEPISILFGAEGTLLDGCVLYGRMSMISLTAFMLQNAFQSFLVVVGRPRMGLLLSIVAGVTNIIGDFLLVYVFDLGILGAVLATISSEILGGIIPLVFFIRNRSTDLRFSLTKIRMRIIGKTCFNGSSEMLSNISMSLVNMLYNMQLMRLVGPDGVVTYGIIMYISFIFVSTFIGYSIGTAPIIGYHFGAENKDELKNILKKSLKIVGVAGAIMFISCELLSGVLSGIFVGYSATLMDMTKNAMHIFAISFLFNGLSIFASNFFTALNNGLISAAISFLRTMVFQVIMIFLLPIFFGLNGIWFSIVAAEILSVIVSFAMLGLFRKRYGY